MPMPDARSEPDLHPIRGRLLQEIRDLLLANPEVFGESSPASRQFRNVRCQLTVQIAIVAAKLYKARFAQVDHICHLLDELSEDRPLSSTVRVWLDDAIDKELRGNKSISVGPREDMSRHRATASARLSA